MIVLGLFLFQDKPVCPSVLDNESPFVTFVCHTPHHQLQMKFNNDSQFIGI